MTLNTGSSFVNSTNTSKTQNSSDDSFRLGAADFTAISIYISLVGVLGLFGNALVIAAFYRYRSLRTSTNTFILHLGLCNLILALLDLIFSLPSTATHQWLFGLSACRFYGLTYHFFCYISLNTLAIISLDRYWVITKPSIGIKITIRRAVLCIAISYGYTVVFTIPVFLQWMNFQEEAFYTGCYLSFAEHTIKSLLYSVILGVFLFAVPFAIMIFCYGSIFKSVKHKGRYAVKLCSARRCDSKWRFTIQRIPHWRTARMIIVVIFVFLVCWSPYVIVSMCISFGTLPNISVLTLEITLLVAKSGVIYNPFIYAALNLRFRTAFFEMLQCDRFVNRKKWGIKTRVLTVSTGDSSGHYVSRTSNCTSTRALVERGGSFLRTCDRCSSSIEGASRCFEYSATATRRPDSMQYENHYLETRKSTNSAPDQELEVNKIKGRQMRKEEENECTNCIKITQEVRNDPVASCETCCVHNMYSKEMCNNEDGFNASEKNKKYRAKEPSVVRNARLRAKEESTGNSNHVKCNCVFAKTVKTKCMCSCKDNWKTRPTAKCKKNRCSLNKHESTFLCTCGPCIKPGKITRDRQTKTDAGDLTLTEQTAEQRLSRNTDSGIRLFQEGRICELCREQIIQEFVTDDMRIKCAGGFGNEGKGYESGNGKRRGTKVLVATPVPEDNDHCLCEKTDLEIFGPKDSKLRHTLKGRRTSEGFHSGMTSPHESFWRRPSLVLINSINPISCKCMVKRTVDGMLQGTTHKQLGTVKVDSH